MKKILNKFISQSGFCSRRQAEVFIKEGKVFVNGKLAEPGIKVEESDEVRVGNKIIKNRKDKIYIILNKPIGYVCTNRRFKNEKNVFDLLPRKVLKNNKLFVVGRLDKESRGLILLTNDGDLTQKITHPKYKHEKKYLVKTDISKNPSAQEVENIIKNFKKGVFIGEGDGKVRAKEAKYVGNQVFDIILTQGKKRQIRRMFESLGYKTTDLFRYELGNFNIKNLPSGKWKEISLKNSLN